MSKKRKLLDEKVDFFLASKWRSDFLDMLDQRISDEDWFKFDKHYLSKEELFEHHTKDECLCHLRITVEACFIDSMSHYAIDGLTLDDISMFLSGKECICRFNQDKNICKKCLKTCEHPDWDEFMDNMPLPKEKMDIKSYMEWLKQNHVDFFNEYEQMLKAFNEVVEDILDDHFEYTISLQTLY